MGLARDLVDEVAVARAIELAGGVPGALELAVPRQETTAFGTVDEFGTFHPAAPPPAPPAFDPWGHTMRRPYNRAHTLGPQAARLYGHNYRESIYSQILSGQEQSQQGGQQHGGEIPAEGVPEGVRQALDGDYPGGDLPFMADGQENAPARPARPRRRGRYLRYTGR